MYSSEKCSDISPPPPTPAVNHTNWNQFVGQQIRKWKMIAAENILHSKGHLVLVVLYEQLQAHPLREVERILDFLHYPYSPEAVRSAVDEGFTSFYRNHTDPFPHFTPQQISLVNNAISAAAERLRSEGLTDVHNQMKMYISDGH